MFTNVSVSVSDIWSIGSIVAYYRVSLTHLTHDGSVSDSLCQPEQPEQSSIKNQSMSMPCACGTTTILSWLQWQVQEYTEGSDEHPRPSVRMAPRLNFLFVPSHSQTIRDHRTSRKASKRHLFHGQRTQILASPASLKGDNSAGKTSSTMFDIQTYSNIFKQSRYEFTRVGRHPCLEFLWISNGNYCVGWLEMLLRFCWARGKIEKIEEIEFFEAAAVGETGWHSKHNAL